MQRTKALAATLIIVLASLLPRPATADPIDYSKLTPAQKAAFTAWVTHARHDYLFRLMAAHERAEAARAEARRRAYPHGLCGGDLPPCYVMWRESRGIITARNPRSSASGKWQALDSTWHHWGGYPHAYLAPEKVQDDFARWLWNHGRGCAHWSAC